MTVSAPDVVFGTVAAMFFGSMLAALFHLRWARRLPALSDLPQFADSQSILCSVVLAARNEETRIEQTIRHLLNQVEVSVEIIVVDDRSTDRTGDILGRLASEDPRVRCARIEQLPEGWLGKCFACYTGARLATGDWILFTDADCWLKPDVIARALGVAARDQVPHVTLTPGVTALTLPGRAWHLAFLVSLANWFAGVNRDKPKAFLGMGAFNLIQTDLYRRCGGYEALRLTVLDDVKLGLLVRRAGGKTRGFIGGDDTECHWGATARDMIRIMEKNYFAAINFRTLGVIAGALVILLLAGLIVAGPFMQTWAGIAVPLGWLSMALPAGLCARRLGWGLGAALMMPFVLPLLFYALFRSAAVTLRQGGIRWRDTFYSLDQLRAGNVR